MKEQKAHYEINGKKVLLEKVIDIKNDIWLQGNIQIISLIGLQKIAAAENIVEKDFRTEIMPTLENRQQTVVNIWLGLKTQESILKAGEMMPENKDEWVRGSGEASMLNTGKIVSSNGKNKYEEYGNIDSQYRFAMAEKRAFSRAMLKMVKLQGVYCEVEAREFKRTGKETDLDY